MSLQGTISHLDAAPRARNRSVAPVADHAQSFAKARRHTILVKLLRVTLPLLTVMSLASYGIGMRAKMGVGGGKLDTGSIAISDQNLTMSNPRYEGFNKDGSKFNVTAKTATQDVRQQGPIELGIIEGFLHQLTNNTIKLTAPRGLFDNKSNQLELFDDIKIRGDDGMRADLTHAMIYIKQNRIVSKQPVAIDMAAGQIRANEMELLQSKKQAIFTDGVATRLKPEPKPAASAPQAAKPGSAAPAAPRMIGASDSPVDVKSRKLEVDDLKKTAIFTGEVEAKQGEATLRAPALHAFYEGAPIATPGAAPTPAADGTAAPAPGKLKRLFVPKDVHLTQGADTVTSDTADFDAVRETAALVGKVEMQSGPDRRATSDRADIDSRNDTILLTGNVVVTQDRNILKGTRLFVDRKSGNTNLSMPVGPGQPPGRISTRFYQAAPSTPAAAAKQAAAKAAQPVTKDASGFVFRTDPNAPIDIDAETLDVVDKAKTATYRGGVVAVQGEFTMKTPEMIATYSGEAGIATPGGAAKQQSAQLQRVRANQKVEVTSSNGQSATGDWADMDVKANTVTLGVSAPGGHVTLKKGTSISYAPKVIIDMTTGVTYFENYIRPTGPTVSQSPTEQRAPYTLPDLPAKKDAATTPAAPTFDTDPTKCTRAVCIKIDPKDGVGVQTGPKPAAPAAADKTNAPSWQTEPAPPTRKKPAGAGTTSGWTSGSPSAN